MNESGSFRNSTQATTPQKSPGARRRRGFNSLSKSIIDVSKRQNKSVDGRGALTALSKSIILKNKKKSRQDKGEWRPQSGFHSPGFGGQAHNSNS